jgi:hypothetical protein
MYSLCTHTTCVSCYDDINETNFVLYKTDSGASSSEDWQSCFYCSECIKYILDTKWTTFMKMLEELDCKATFKRILEEGVPYMFRDSKLTEKDVKLFFFDGKEQSGIYKNPYPKVKIEEVLQNIKNTLENESMS